MKVFKGFNEWGPACPICNTKKDCETVLVPIHGTQQGNKERVQQVHKDCVVLILKMHNYDIPDFE